MTSVIIFVISYIAITLLILFILCVKWKYEEGEWELNDITHEVEPVTKEDHRDRIVFISLFWPIAVVAVLGLLPFKLMEKLAEKWISKNQ